MSWANLDDRLHAHPKVRRLQRVPILGAEAFGIWCWCLSWCRAFRPMTGVVSVDDVADDWGSDRDHMADVFATLLSVHLVDAVEDDSGTFVIHDWCDWQLTAQQRGGLHGAAAAERDPGTGRFARPPVGDQPDSAGSPDGSPAGRTSPRLSSPRLSEPGEPAQSTFRENVTPPLPFHPVPKPGGKRR